MKASATANEPAANMSIDEREGMLLPFKKR